MARNPNPFSWTIENFLDLYHEEGVSVESPVFTDVRGPLRTEWQLIFYPGGAGEMSTKDNSFDFGTTYPYGSESIYLKIVRCNYSNVLAAKFWIQCTSYAGGFYQIHNRERKEETHFSIMHSSTWGWHHLPITKGWRPAPNTINPVRPHLLTLCCDIYNLVITEMPINVFNPNSVRSCPHQYWSFYEQQKLTDLVIGVGTKEFRVHKLVLANCSPVFKAMFDHEMTESVQNRLEISDFDADTVEKMIKFMYTGSCENPGGNASELLASAEKYDLGELKASCEKYLAGCIDAGNAATLLQLADTHRAPDLKKTALKFIQDNIEQVMTSPGWVSLLSCPSLVDEFIKFSFSQKVRNHCDRK